ncbi:hypothetical protein ACFC00_06005 [Streptomyces adustus]
MSNDEDTRDAAMAAFQQVRRFHPELMARKRVEATTGNAGRST